MTDPTDPIAENEALWDAWTDIHEASEFYDLDGFRRGGVRVREEEIAAVGDVTGKSLLHLQCHFGIDTLSWARLGARVTGVDFSANAIVLAQRLATEIGIADARFIRSAVYDLPDVLDEQFDVVYTSRGVIGWLPDIRRWAEVVARYTAPGGLFFINEIHPVAQALENEGVAPGELRFDYPYWEHRDPLTFDVKGSYADPTADTSGLREHGWDHGLGELVTALIAAGLQIESLVEHPYLEWAADFLVERTGTGRWYLPESVKGEMPLMFSLLARRPAG